MKKAPEQLKGLNVKLPESLVNEVKILLLDPLTGRTRYGGMATLIRTLLQNWLDEQREKGEVNINE